MPASLILTLTKLVSTIVFNELIGNDDHDNAQLLCEQLQRDITEIQVEAHPFSTNIVFFSWQGKNMSALQFNESCLTHGVRFSQVDENRFRAVMHLGVKRKDIYL